MILLLLMRGELILRKMSVLSMQQYLVVLVAILQESLSKTVSTTFLSQERNDF